MNIFPAIDLKAGSCVRLYQGSFEQVTAYSADPLAVAKSFAQQGAQFLHVVDLDGARTGEAANREVLLQIVQETALVVQLGGGIRQAAQLQACFAAGVARVVVGSMAIAQPEIVQQWLQEWGTEKIVLGLDVRINAQGIPMLASHGWSVETARSLWEFLDEYQLDGLRVLCTDIERDGTLLGPNLELYAECLRRYPQLYLQASGGIGQLQDLQQLAAIPVAEVIIGKALYEQRFSLAQALKMQITPRGRLC